MDDYIKFCIKCSWNDPDIGCISPRGEELWQCPMYIHYHPDEVKEFYEYLNNSNNLTRCDYE